MADMQEIQALVQSLGETTVNTLGKANLARLDIFVDSPNGTAFAEIALHDNTWAQQSMAIDRMLEVRETFFDELAIEYRFITMDSETRAAAEARRPAFCMA